MSTSYTITKKIEAHESSCEISIGVENRDSGYYIYSPDMSYEEFRLAIIKQIEVLSYISDDPEATLKRFNVDYGDTE